MLKFIKKYKVILLILLASVFLRFFKLSSVPVSLFGDEMDVGYHAYSLLKTGRDYSGNFLPIHLRSLAEWRTPLYLYSCIPTVALFGISPLGVRLPAAIFGVLGVWGIYLLTNKLFKDKELVIFKYKFSIGEVASFVLAISPWHIQYSRAGFEVTQLLAFLIFGLYFFFRALDEKGKFLWLSVLLLTFTPWIYSTAKFFTPFLLLFLFLVWRKRILSFNKKTLISSLVAGLVVGVPIVISTLFGGGAQRFGYVSVFSNPVTEAEVGVQREIDARVRGEVGAGLSPKLFDRLMHNKYTFWSKNILTNIFESYSFDFLFVKGDLNLRHSIDGMGMFYMVESLALILGLIYFAVGKEDIKKKALIFFWTLVGILPAAITRDGGNHATRLILILPPLVILISFGILKIFEFSKGTAWRKILPIFYVTALFINFVFYQHDYWIHNPWYSERWWHYGWKQAITQVKDVQNNYDNIVISMAGEPAWIFFAASYEYPPRQWQENFPVGNDVVLEGFGKVSHIDKFYFGSPEGGLYEWGDVLNKNTLYVANASEVNINLIEEPERLPENLTLVGSVQYPSGEPAFYLLSGK